jgi:hypothetical protein
MNKKAFGCGESPFIRRRLATQTRRLVGWLDDFVIDDVADVIRVASRSCGLESDWAMRIALRARARATGMLGTDLVAKAAPDYRNVSMAVFEPTADECVSRHSPREANRSPRPG